MSAQYHDVYVDEVGTWHLSQSARAACVWAERIEGHWTEPKCVVSRDFPDSQVFEVLDASKGDATVIVTILIDGNIAKHSFGKGPWPEWFSTIKFVEDLPV